MDQPKTKPEHALMDAIGFTEEDLEANQQDHMTEWQCSRLRRRRNLRWIGCASVLVVFCLAFALILGLSVLTDDESFPSVEVHSLIGLVTVLILIPVVIFEGKKFQDDLHLRGVIRTAEGRVHKEADDAGEGGVHYTLRIQDLNFPIKERVYWAFKDDNTYRIYYAPHSKTILSAEWLREET